MANEYGIKETKELFEALALIGATAKKIVKTGLKPESFSYLVELATKYSVLVDGLKDISEIKNEIKDLNIAEIQELVTFIHEKVKEVENA